MLRPFAALMTDPGVWALSRRSTAKGFGIGVFCAWLPIPFQTLVVLTLTVWLRVNLPVAILASFISNPFSMGPMMVSAYMLGNWMLQRSPKMEEDSLSLGMILQEIERIGTPLLLGSITLGVITALIAATVINITWQYSLMRQFRRRRARRRLLGIRFRRPKRRPRASKADEPRKSE
ncbi:uncharacterized protein (DUF2062 family) [Natronospira proteinivora]|uniref:Uncharacterized protein (DUF2062 family) n=1 Tax=Natronospira proteinivora TaxID=1807133 RepID=A0ABT1G5Y0_9GAMM|nr:DUF2062 domain-containing protein [Natronospira proteinivora]MCP1726701.1 uncharacterized protein (DUF2062 family) [Natronospira proteinivora]